MLRLYPAPPQELPVKGTYLAERLHTKGSPVRPYVYADFVMSLDGRIALGEAAKETGELPEALPNASDLRLMLELIAQADCLITHGGYLRAVAEGRLEDIMQVGLRRGREDLAAWRRGEGLAAQPAILVASASLDFPLPPSLAQHGQRVIIATGAASSAAKREAWRGRGYEVIIAGSGAMVEGAPLTQALGERGFRSLFLLAGPLMLETMLRDGQLARLYLTVVHRLIGGSEFLTMLRGPELGSAGALNLAALYYEAAGASGVGQFFAQFDAAAP
jgi:riboflavin biosynthesis pyrimidine reductase